MKSAVILVLIAASVFAETYIYKEVTGGRESSHIYTISKRRDGYFVRRIHEMAAETTDIEEITTDTNFATLTWRFVEPSESTELWGRRTGTKITVRGIHKKVPVCRTFTIDGRPWMQTFALNLEGFLKAPITSSEFWALGAFKPGEIKIADFAALKKERTSVSVAGRNCTAQRVRVSLTGIRSSLWHGNYFHDLDSGAYIRYEGVNGPPGTPPTKIELVAVR